MGIKNIIPSQVLNSRGEPTVKVKMVAENGKTASFVVPGGASVGKNEAVKKFDGGDVYGGKSVLDNIKSIKTVIAPKFIGYPLDHQEDFDSLLIALDGTPTKENLGSNTILALSVAYYKLSAKLSNKPLWQYTAEKLKTSPEFPRIYANLVGGGKHAPGLDIQEFMIVPQSKKPNEAIEEIVRVYETVKTIMTSLYGPTGKLSGDEGAIAPLGARTEVVLEALSGLSQKSEKKFDIALDVAANSFYDGKNYSFEGQSVHANDLMAVYQDWNNKFGLYSIEDPFAEDDLEGIELLKTTPREKGSFMVIGDDFTVTNSEKIKEYSENKIIDGVIIKPDQVGSMSEVINAIMTSKQAGLKIIVSHRSGENNDGFIVDLAYAIGADGIKIGAPNRGERIAKYNRLLDIENDLKAVSGDVDDVAQTQSAPTPQRTESQNLNVAPLANSQHASIDLDNGQVNTKKPEETIKNMTGGSKDFHFGKQADSTSHGIESNIAEAETDHNENNKTLDNAALTPKELPAVNDVKINPPENPIPIVPQEPTAATTSFQNATSELNPALRANDGSQLGTGNTPTISA
jgi:enolase